MSYIYLFSAIIFEVIGTIKEIPIAVAYATWAGLGIFLITLFSYIVHDQSLGWQSILGLLLIAMGVAIVNTFKNQNIL